MRTVEEHAGVVTGLLHRLPAQLLPLAEARGRVLAEDLVAGLDLPPFPNSAMDGYAVRVSELEDRAGDPIALPVSLPVSQDIPAGRTDTAPLVPGTAARIMTGAPIPDGADGIVPVEHTDGGVGDPGAAGATVTIHDLPVPGRHVRTRGEDVAVGTVVLPAGTELGPPQLGVAAALGVAELPVVRPARVLVLSTGTELVVPGQPLGPGQIYESNSVMLAAALSAIGAEPVLAHLVADDVTAFRAELDRAAAVGTPEQVDLIVTSGGVSAGAYEVVKDALTGQGVEFAKVAMQPGMPQGAGVLATAVGDIPVVTLPGNPVSSYVSFEVFLRPALLAAMGHAGTTRPLLWLPLSAPLDSPPGKRQFRRALVDAATGTVAPWGGPGSHLLAWLAGSDAMIVVPEDATSLEAGAPVEVWLLD
ncbi:molybdopterin molybdotransferase MoeA [Nakamurella leprariae]|uniref:Molybdopterin molybdenumtransferase n=1 Tax=Nakamurella leprariae TaxID=2803911 RepID=A0A939BVG4_9ACTN|nr:gephyrin-like molybdotransferase Glp [Nakamurella leprariae]MBM9466493.1 molybdopterin molybdotransferase MoeA [Nakamurella leprariae]